MPEEVVTVGAVLWAGAEVRSARTASDGSDCRSTGAASDGASDARRRDANMCVL